MKTPQNADSMYLDCGIMYKFDFLLCFNVFSKFTILSYWSGASAGSLAEARLFSPPGLSCIARTPTPPPRPPAPPRPACWCCAPGKACERGGAAGARRLWRGRAEQAAQRTALSASRRVGNTAAAGCTQSSFPLSFSLPSRWIPLGF